MGVKGVAQLVQQFGDDDVADRVAQGLQRDGQPSGYFCTVAASGRDRRAQSARPAHFLTIAKTQNFMSEALYGRLANKARCSFVSTDSVRGTCGSGGYSF
jgi:hypothetical protein